MKNFSRMLLNLKDFAEICDSFGSGRTPMLASGLSGICLLYTSPRQRGGPPSP